MHRSAQIGTWMALFTLALVSGCSASTPADRAESPPAPAAAFGRAGQWTALPASPLGARYEVDGAWVADRFVVVGGWSSPICPAAASCLAPADPPLRDGASFDPATGRWTRIADAPVPISGLNTVVVGDQLYTLTNENLGRADSPAAFLSYDPRQNLWTRHPRPPGPGGLVAAGSTVVLVNGSDEDEPGIDAAFDPATNRWRQLPDDPLGPSFGRSAVWVDGALLLAAGDLVPNPGSDAPVLTRIARLDDNLSRWSTLPDSQIIGAGPVAVAGLAVWPYTGSADGGEVGNWGRSYPEGGIFDPSTRTWHPLPTSSVASSSPCCGGTVVGAKVMVNHQLLDPVTQQWTPVPALPGTPRTGAAALGSPQALLVWGGAVAETGSADRTQENLATGYLWRSSES